MAGAKAEIELLKRTVIGDGNDRHQIELMAEHLRQSPPWDQLEPRLRAMTRMLVRRHRRLIARVAKALLERTTLSGVELDEPGRPQYRRRKAQPRRPVPAGDGDRRGGPTGTEAPTTGMKSARKRAPPTVDDVATIPNASVRRARTLIWTPNGHATSPAQLSN